MTAPLVDIHRHRGRFFEILQETERTQTAVMTIAPGRDGGPEETHGGDQVVYVVEGEAVVTIEGTAHQAGVGACVLISAVAPTMCATRARGRCSSSPSTRRRPTDP